MRKFAPLIFVTFLIPLAFAQNVANGGHAKSGQKYLSTDPNAGTDSTSAVANVARTPTTAGKLKYLAENEDALYRNINDLIADNNALRAQIFDLQTKIGELQTKPAPKYQIAATRWSDGQMSFTQVFRVNTATGEVCQFVGPKYAKGELAGTGIPLCSN